ncbi:MAG: FAD-dependent oxidoreductase, partial [Alphaproteobacteria bacterium]|nr:FAD-dependent oxidoreductase [Alphaproteobacteria bacterium]
MISDTNFIPNRSLLNIAVIGGGIAGMAAAWLLNQRHRITVYEQNEYIGGHSNTVDVPCAGHPTPVDTGFIVYNEQNYPNLAALFRYFDVPTKPSEMSFSASIDGGSFEYSGTNLNGLLGQRRNVLRPRFWSMLRDLLRFYREAPNLLTDRNNGDLTLGDYLRRGRYGAAFIETHLLPMGAAIWSTTARQMEDYPVRSFVRFFVNHGLVNLKNRPAWRTVDGGSRQYVKRLTASYCGKIRFGGARAISRLPNGVVVEDRNGNVEAYDHVVVATHADEALQLLRDTAPVEQQL